MKTLIALFTRGRVDRQKTLQRLTPEARRRVTVFCHPGELAAHQRNWGGKVAAIEEYSTACRGVGDIRDYIVVEAADRGFGGVFFLDEDPCSGKQRQFHRRGPGIHLFDDVRLGSGTVGHLRRGGSFV